MLKFIFKSFGGDAKREAKEIILKEFFNSSKQKKAVKKAARESAEDQRILMARYNQQLANQR